MLENIMNTVYNALLLGKILFESICLNIFVPTTGLRAIEYEKMLSESSSSSKTNKRLLPLPAPIPRRRIANIDPDIDGGDADIDTAALNQKDEMSIAQFITARIYAKKMIEFLRMRQEIKRIEHDRMMKMKEKQEKRQKQNRQIAGSENSSVNKNKAVDNLVMIQS